MTSDSNPPEQPPQPDPLGSAKAAIQGTDWASPAGLVALSAVLLLGVEIVFTIVMRRWGGANTLILIVAIAVLLVQFGRAGFLTKFGSVSALLKLFGYIIAFYGAFHLLGDIRGGFRYRGITWLPLLLTYAAYVAALMGARGINTDDA